MPRKEDNAIRVTAAVIADGSRVLVGRRAPGKHLAGYWEFPGGKIEKGERPEECLHRELLEELELEFEIGDFLCRNRHFYGNKEIILLAYEARPSSLKPAQIQLRLNSHDAFRWLHPPDLLDIRLAPADRPIAEHLIDAASRPSATVGGRRPENPEGA